MGLIMINTFDDITDAVTDVIERAHPLLRNKQLFYAAVETAFYDYECKIKSDVKAHVCERVRCGIELINNL